MKDRSLTLSPLTTRQKALLAGVLLLALGVRLWGIDFGLPYVYHPDEPNYVRTAVRMAQTGDLNPHFFNFPSFLFYANVLAYQPVYWIGRLVGAFESWEDVTAPQMNVMASGVTATPVTFFAGRLVTLFLGLAVVWLVFLAARQLAGSRAALLGALLAAISPTSAIHSHFITPDVPQAFWVALAFWGAVGVYRRGRWGDYVVAGLAAGGAASTKYHGVLILSALLAAHLLRTGNRFRTLPTLKLFLALAASGVAFVIITPYSLLDFGAFWRGVTYEGRHYAQGHLGMEGDTVSWYMDYLWRIEGPVVVLALLEIGRGIRRRSKETLLLAVFPAVFYLFINTFTIRNDRTLLPILPFVAILAASWLIERFRRRQDRVEHGVSLGITLLLLILSIVLPASGVLKRGFILYYPDSAIVNDTTWVPVTGFLAGLLVLLGVQTWVAMQAPTLAQKRAHLIATGLIGLAALALPLGQTILADYALTLTDSRETGRVWIHENLPPGARIAVESYAPYIDPMRYWVEGATRMIQHDPAWYLDQEFEYLVYSQRMFLRFYRDPERYAAQIAQYDRLFARFEPLKTLTDGGYEVRIYKTGVYD